ncbi:hypothetical protein QAD02_011773 [Eretmocerus hayati]|uniref:Uncharacterized protein n=1 Tax=Eretmocerus hayati TaxID=131215 RepID=A0ACC2P0L9_9HYME|nr:hypothetical protein QAD02_011773 [Eretmocerus hayati]
MLRLTISTYDQVSRYERLKGYLKKLYQDHEPKKSLTLTQEQVSRFLNVAPDDTYLVFKVILIFGFLGAMRREEISKLKRNDVTDGVDSNGNHYLLVQVNNTKTKVDRPFAICDQDLYLICKKYMGIREKILESDRFFMRYANGKCTNQAIGIDTCGGIPKRIGEYLKLPEASRYTGHCLRRTSATFLIDAGGDITALNDMEAGDLIQLL